MAEYVDREKAIALIEEKQKELCPVGRYSRHYVYGSDREKYDSWEEIIDQLENMETADVVPVVHTKWENNKDEYPECTNCGYMPMFDPAIDDIYYSPYCPQCGAKMDL